MRLLTGAVVDRAQQLGKQAARGPVDASPSPTRVLAGVARPAVPAISVVVPTLDEELLLPRCLASLKDQVEHEVIVVDGGSRDRTVAIAEEADALVLHSPRANRGLQMNLGAQRSGGRVLLFLHADSILPPGALAAVEELLGSRADVVGGCFTMRLDSRSPLCRLASWGGNLYHRSGRPLFGDRGVFVRRDTFEEMGGFRELPIMEDVDLGRRLRKPPGDMATRGRLASGACAKRRLVMLCGPVISSARSFERLGTLRLLARIVLACAAFKCGLPVQHIARVYRGIDHPLPAE
jgi:rSAM/selenodomain-associated transferase 2